LALPMAFIVLALFIASVILALPFVFIALTGPILLGNFFYRL